MKEALSEIIQLATVDLEPWVLMVADILKSFPGTGSLNLDLEEQNPNVQDILGELREKGRKRAWLVCFKAVTVVLFTEVWVWSWIVSPSPYSERVWGIGHASTGVPVPKQECFNHSGGTPNPPCQAFPAETEAQECNSQGRAASEM